MSREERTEQQTVTTIRCDFCDNGKSWDRAKACANGCGKDVCHRCGKDDPTDYGDYIDRFCLPCWALEGRAIYFGYITVSDTRRETLRDEWRKAAEEKR